ncbi:hypothetical protein GCM10023158_19850 [Gluconacetobacter tumulicola]
MQLSDIQNWVVIPTLMQIPGVAAVSNFGGLTKEYQLLLDPDALNRYHIGINDVLAVLKNNNVARPSLPPLSASIIPNRNRDRVHVCVQAT